MKYLRTGLFILAGLMHCFTSCVNNDYRKSMTIGICDIDGDGLADRCKVSYNENTGKIINYDIESTCGKRKYNINTDVLEDYLQKRLNDRKR